MKKIVAAASAVFLMALVAPGHPQSLGDLAKKEKERRDKVKTESKVITNSDTSRYKGGAVTTGSLPAPPAPEKPEGEMPATGTVSAPGAPKANPDEPTDLQGRTESFWKQTFTDARQKVKELENESNVLILRINDLQTQLYRETDGNKQLALQREIQKAFYEQDQNKENLAKAKSQLEALEKEARSSGALPGWINP